LQLKIKLFDEINAIFFLMALEGLSSYRRSLKHLQKRTSGTSNHEIS
jgi:hypothetical protein